MEMSERPDNHADERQLRLPQALADELVALYARRVEVPARVDEAVLAQAQRQLARRRRARVFRRSLVSAAAVAAAIALLVWVVRPSALPHAPASRGPIAEQRDAGPSRHVTILDAFNLARQIEAGGPLSPKWDVNGDGVVNQKDVDALARTAVAVSGGRA
jgi:hypothetical protein